MSSSVSAGGSGQRVAATQLALTVTVTHTHIVVVVHTEIGGLLLRLHGDSACGQHEGWPRCGVTRGLQLLLTLLLAVLLLLFSCHYHYPYTCNAASEYRAKRTVLMVSELRRAVCVSE